MHYWTPETAERRNAPLTVAAPNTRFARRLRVESDGNRFAVFWRDSKPACRRLGLL